MKNSHGLFRLLVAGLMCAAVSAGATAQTESKPGVPAKLPPPIKSIGGVPAAAGPGSKTPPLQRTKTLLPPAPTRAPSASPPAQNDRPPVMTPGSGLVRPLRPGDHVSGGPGGHHPGGGIHIDGRYRDDRFRLGFHIGSGYPNYGYYPRYAYGARWYWPYSSYYSRDSYYGLPQYWYGYMDPYLTSGMSAARPAAPAAPARELTTLERADLALAEGRAVDAIAHYRRHLAEHPDDAGAMRSLGLALIDGRRLDQGVAVLAMAYEKQPNLARDTVSAAQLEGSSLDLRRRVTALVTFATRVKTGSAWLAVAVLMQAEGRDEQAARMIDRAREAGLGEPISAAMLTALGR